jgi:DNA-binding PadR family transcriptional regulator
MAPRRNQTVKPRFFHILLALSDRDRHGSDIVREVETQTSGELKLWPAMLYSSIEQMTDAGLIEELDQTERPEGASGRRRYFRITGDGRRMLTEEAHRFSRLADLAASKNVLTERREA